MTKAPTSLRATDHVTLTFGLISVPVAIYGGEVSDHGIARKQFRVVPQTGPDGAVLTDDQGNPLTEDHPAGVMPYDKITGEPIDRSEVVRKIATEYGFVFVEDSEIEQLFEISPKTLVVKAFQPQHLFYAGHYVPKALYYLVADKMVVGKKKVVNKPAQTNLALVLKAMKEEGALALVELTSRGIPKPAVLLPNGTLWVVHHEDALREAPELPEIDLDPALVGLGRQLVRQQWKDDVQDLTDLRSALIQNFADEKAKAGDFGKPEEVVVPETQASGTDDLMAMLSASLIAA